MIDPLVSVNTFQMDPTLLLIWGCVMVALAAPEEQDAHAKIIEDANYNDGSGNYNFSYETSNGLRRTEVGELIKTGESEKLVIRGSYSYTDPNGKEVIVYYTADENGYVTTKPDMQVSILEVSPGVLASLLGR